MLVITLIKLKWMRRPAMENVYKILGRNSGKKRPRRTLENNIKIDPK
jgi:hypothetical protein